MSLSSILYPRLGHNAVLVRMAKGTLAAALAAGGVYLANNSGTEAANGELPELIGAVLGVIALGLDKLSTEIGNK